MTDLWQNLAALTTPLVLYGTGDGADKILDTMEAKGLHADGVFASDGFVRKRTFRGMPVLSYREALARFGEQMTVLVAFGSSRPEVLERFAYLAARHTLYVPDVPVAGGELFDAAFVEAHREAIDEARTLWADEASRRLYDAVWEAKQYGSWEALLREVSDEDAIFSLLHPESFTLALDLGAYVGDTAEELIERAPSLKTVIAVEPDERNFTKLCFATAASGKVEPHFAAAWHCREALSFRRGGGRGIRGAKGEKTVTVMGMTADELLAGRRPDYIKIDVEGAERQAIAGCKSCLAHAPALRIALYHKSADLFEIPLLIHRLNARYDLYLRRKLSVPAWDLDLIAVRKETDDV